MDDIYLKVYLNKSELHEGQDNLVLTFEEGVMSDAAIKRYAAIKSQLEASYLGQLIDGLIEGTTYTSDNLTDQHIQLLNRLVGSVTSEVGRALVAITIMQLTIKALAPEQSVMLHKGSPSGSSFSWKEGISMRTLDKYYITPVLRRYDLIRLNADGIMMTRSLAENYPYSKLYKAQIKGARDEWLEIVLQLEKNTIPAEDALKYLLSLLINRASNFKELADKVLGKIAKLDVKSLGQVRSLIQKHIDASGYKARLFEISIHSYFQALDDLNLLDGLNVKPLSQMRSANKKHGNIGDVELLDGQEIVVAWDAKYGKEYLRDELEEIYEKITKKPYGLQAIGFVTSSNPLLDEEITSRIAEINDLSGNQIEILTFDAWLHKYAKEYGEADSLAIAKAWLKAYAESLAQKRRPAAPIDEPCNAWLESLLDTVG